MGHDKAKGGRTHPLCGYRCAFGRRRYLRGELRVSRNHDPVKRVTIRRFLDNMDSRTAPARNHRAIDDDVANTDLCCPGKLQLCPTRYPMNRRTFLSIVAAGAATSLVPG